MFTLLTVLSDFTETTTGVLVNELQTSSSVFA